MIAQSVCQNYFPVVFKSSDLYHTFRTQLPLKLHKNQPILLYTRMRGFACHTNLPNYIQFVDNWWNIAKFSAKRESPEKEVNFLLVGKFDEIRFITYVK